MDWQNDLLKARDKNGKKYSETYIMIKADERVRGNVKENVTCPTIGTRHIPQKATAIDIGDSNRTANRRRR